VSTNLESFNSTVLYRPSLRFFLSQNTQTTSRVFSTACALVPLASFLITFIKSAACELSQQSTACRSRSRFHSHSQGPYKGYKMNDTSTAAVLVHDLCSHHTRTGRHCPRCPTPYRAFATAPCVPTALRTLIYRPPSLSLRNFGPQSPSTTFLPNF
jgi:hypothetical protein